MQKEIRYTATIGFFDGVHRGHRFLIDQLKRVAKERHQASMVVTFGQHPRLVLQPDWQPQLLSTAEEKIALLQQTGIDRLEVVPFDRKMSELSAHDFMKEVLQGQLNVSTLLTGYDNRFGHGRQETFDDYVRYGEELGIEVLGNERLQLEESDNITPSSSLIRRQLLDGDVSEAARCLGYRYTLSGSVVHGEQIGRQLGFPTANLQPDDACKLIPANGAYAVLVHTSPDKVLSGMMNIGTRPTFEGHQKTLEIHLFDFDGNLYGRQLRVVFISRLRSERHFDDAASLARQLQQDEQQAKQILNTI